ncbi:phosphatidylinositol mannoside acyltransferase [Streptomyces radicis]|uniref:Phosphatidylinositol mannoside acyltransferase n=1 Tax=Streptomyces radicis TaxID=1750517 RepID=A0A3A9WJ86_9ACTN|nr:phosphatidylinositol mannoside acyltransferase [Streptomyces radicis]RKN12682.1 phosphatidylinositol mannoside acyltransferase [Streptomyces radicis]RKN27554.1 phosphatidylinositol mannoside acyltransferase [Streptomyces radicis]
MRDRLADALYAAGWSTIRRMPEPAAQALGRRVADSAWRRRGAGVLRLEANLARVVPGAGPEELRELTRAGMRSYLRYWMETFRLPAWSTERIKGAFQTQDFEHLTDAIDGDRGVILALPHMANWDLAGAWLVTALGAEFGTVAERVKPERLYDRFVAYREALGMEVLPHTGGASFGRLARRLRAGGLVCLVADRDLSASGVDVTFFGETARMPGGPALLAQQTGAMLLPVSLWYDEPPVMRGRILPPVPVPETGTRAERTAVMTQALADHFAAGIAAHPQDWHMLQPLWPADVARHAAAAGGGGRGGSGRGGGTA